MKQQTAGKELVIKS